MEIRIWGTIAVYTTTGFFTDYQNRVFGYADSKVDIRFSIWSMFQFGVWHFYQVCNIFGRLCIASEIL